MVSIRKMYGLTVRDLTDSDDEEAEIFGPDEVHRLAEDSPFSPLPGFEGETVKHSMSPVRSGGYNGSGDGGDSYFSSSAGAPDYGYDDETRKFILDLAKRYGVNEGVAEHMMDDMLSRRAEGKDPRWDDLLPDYIRSDLEKDSDGGGLNGGRGPIRCRVCRDNDVDVPGDVCPSCKAAHGEDGSHWVAYPIASQFWIDGHYDEASYASAMAGWASDYAEWKSANDAYDAYVAAHSAWETAYAKWESAKEDYDDYLSALSAWQELYDAWDVAYTAYQEYLIALAEWTVVHDEWVLANNAYQTYLSDYSTWQSQEPQLSNYWDSCLNDYDYDAYNSAHSSWQSAEPTQVNDPGTEPQAPEEVEDPGDAPTAPDSVSDPGRAPSEPSAVDNPGDAPEQPRRSDFWISREFDQSGYDAALSAWRAAQ